MTRPAGTTPVKGLPYPGSANIHSQSPMAIQSLAEAIDRNLSTVVGGYKFGFAAGNWQLDGDGACVVPPSLLGLKSIVGMLVNIGTFAGGTYKIGWATGSASSSGRFLVTAAGASLTFPGPPDSFANVVVSACVMAWGSQ